MPPTRAARVAAPLILLLNGGEETFLQARRPHVPNQGANNFA